MSSNSSQNSSFSKNILCYHDDTHAAVLYCKNCKSNLCKECSDDFHSWKAFSKHEVVRLNVKLEEPMPINCHSHPKEEAYLICKESRCKGKNRPICIWCHQYDKHKGHRYELLKDECTKVKTNITNCLKKIETKTITCDKLLDEYDRCIDSYSDKNEFMKAQRNKIEKIYSDAKTMALKKLDDFAENRVELLKLLKNQYENDRDKLDNMKMLIRSFEELEMKDILENGENVEVLARKVEQTVPEPTDTVPSKCYNLKYPSSELLNIKVEYIHPAISQCKLKTPQRIVAVYHLDLNNCPYKPLPHYYFGSENVEEQENGWLFTYNDGRQILSLKERPTDSTIDLSKYTYIAVMDLHAEDWKQREVLVREELKYNWCSTLMINTDNIDWTLDGKFLNVFSKLHRIDKRVRVVGPSQNKPLDAASYLWPSMRRSEGFRCLLDCVSESTPGDDGVRCRGDFRRSSASQDHDDPSQVQQSDAGLF